MSQISYRIDQTNTPPQLEIIGDWQLGSAPDGASLARACAEYPEELVVRADTVGSWDSSLAIALLSLKREREALQRSTDFSLLPAELKALLHLATEIPTYQGTTENNKTSGIHRFLQTLGAQWEGLCATLIFLGDTARALIRWLGAKAKTRRSDIFYFIDQGGPKALAIVTLISLLVGMILAYLGSVQLRQMGAQVYVADLVAIGMVREMGALMTAVIMAGRTGAAYAAQLGTMQVNEEIDALKVMGISAIEFLVLPRLLALVFVMPLLTIYADVIGMIGGALIATSMDVSFTQYVLQSQGAVDWLDISTGLIKSVFFAILIAIAGCQAGLNCGRNSNAVGMAATNAVVRAIVYLVVADAAFNILYDKVGI